ncbi:MAG: hypothetical protein JSS50_05360 [Proteobacteria bacterium]|nr:hypothetical protein [Pseudomonadota bacterium]
MHLDNRALITTPLVGITIGLGCVIIGSTLAIVKHELALVPIASSNLAMVLNIIGTTTMIFSGLLLSAGNTAVGKKEKQEGSIRLGTFSTFIICVILTSVSYGALHLGVSAALHSHLDDGYSLLTQSGISLVVGCCAGLLLAAAVMSSEGSMSRAEKYRMGTIITAGSGALFAATTAVGPTITLYMGEAAASAAEAISMEILLALGIIITTTTAVLAAPNIYAVYSKGSAQQKV